MREDLAQGIIDFVQAYRKKNGYSPTFREIQEGVKGLASTSHVAYYVEAMEREGRVEHTPFKSRTIRVREG